METLFRLSLLRPPVEPDPDHPSIDLAQESTFQQRLAAALENEDRRGSAVAAAREFIQSEAFVGDPRDLNLADELAAFAGAVGGLEENDGGIRQQLLGTIEDAFGASADQVVDRADFREAVDRLRDSIVAIKYVQEAHDRPLQELTQRLRDLELIERTAAGPDFPLDLAELQRHRQRSLRLPSDPQLASILSAARREEERRKRQRAAAAERREHVADMLERFRHLTEAVAELTRLQPTDLVSTPVRAAEAVSVADDLAPPTLLRQQLGFSRQLSDLALRGVEETIDGGGQDGRGQQGLGEASELASTALSATHRLLAGQPAFEPPDLSEIGFRASPAAVERLSETTTALLDGRRLSLGDHALDRVVERLGGDLVEVRNHLDGLFADVARTSVRRIGNALVATVTPTASAWTDLVFAGGFADLLDLVAPDDRIPHTRGDVAPAGIADLLVVKQQLVRYQGADVAHIENVLRGELKAREHTRRRETEELTFVETELTVAEERELESTTRFEMSQETSTTIKEDASLKAGLTVSGKYGPTVEFSASAEGSLSRSKEEATKAASSFSQDVTERSARKVTERILERSSLRVTNEVIEKNEHRLDNVDGDGHISGVYQWVEKVYQAQMFNYGLRTLFDFMVPEPAAMLIHVMTSAHASATTLTKPPAFTLQPDQVTEWNYGYWVKVYGATDVDPPPEPWTTASLDFSAGGGDDKTDYNHSGQLAVPDGYQAVHGTVGVVTNIWESSASVDVVLGRRAKRLDGFEVWSTSLDDERGTVPFGLNTLRVSDIAAAVEVKCQRTARALKQWAADTHAKLTNAYRARLSEYEEQLAALEMQAGVEIEGQNPALNLQVMKDELKKHCISILTDQHFDLFDAVETGYYGLPQIDVFEAAGEGAYVRFFEQAFEWEHLTWVTYPYFWGRKNQWKERVAYGDPDPLFNEFLKAGYCRVSVPARPGFEGAIDHFMSFGELWNGGPLPPISSDLYLPIADELAERLDRPGEEIPQGDPWPVRVPTTLVRLRADDALPTWVQNDEGDWVEA